MKIGVDSSVIIAAVHANHPLHAVSAQWLNGVFEEHTVIVAHHSILETYAVLTRLPSQYRFSPSEAQTVIHGTLDGNAAVARFEGSDIWRILDTLVGIPASGGTSYDAFILRILEEAGVDCVATYNEADFQRLASSARIIDPRD